MGAFLPLSERMKGLLWVEYVYRLISSYSQPYLLTIFYINKLTLTDPHCAKPFIAQEKKTPISNVIGTALKGLVFELKGSPVLACLLH